MTRTSMGLTAVLLMLCAGWLDFVAPARLVAQTPGFALVATIPGAADLVEVSDGRAYITSVRTLTVFDVTDAADPKRGGSYEFPEKIWGFQVVDTLVYAAVDFFGLAVLDASDIAAPSLRASVATPGQAKGVAVFETTALVADHVEGVNLVDLSNPTEPVILGGFYLDGYARDVTASGRLAYAVDAPTGVYVFDLSASDPLEPIGTVQSATAPSSVEVPPVSSGETTDLVCMVGGGLLQVYDVSSPEAPGKTAELRTPGGRPRRVTLRGHLAYVADGPAGVQVVDLSTPSEPTIVSSYATPRPARDVAVTASHLFVAVGEEEGDEDGAVLILQLSP